MVLLRVGDKKPWKEWLSHGALILSATGVVSSGLLLEALSWIVEKR